MMPLVRRVSFVLLLLAPRPALEGQQVIVTERLEELQSRAARDSNDPAAHYNVAMGFWSKKRYAQAEASLQTAVSIDPRFAEAYLALSVVRAWDDDFWRNLRKAEGDSGVRARVRSSNSHYRKAFLLDPLVDIKILGGASRIAMGSPWFRRFTQAFKDLVEGKYDKAYGALDKEMAFWGGRAGSDSAPAIIVWLHGLSAARINQYDVAIHDMQNMIARVRKEASQDSTEDVPLVTNEFRYMMAALHQKAGRTDQAIELYRQVAEADAGNYMAHVQLARLFEAVKDYPRAVGERMNAVNANPDDSSLLLDLGITLGKAGMMPQAESRLQMAAELNPRDARPYFWLGMSQMEQGKNPEAKASFTRFLELAPSRYERQIAMAKERLAQLP
jgi:tetratricopeptide (TPR) repeat protein